MKESQLYYEHGLDLLGEDNESAFSLLETAALRGHVEAAYRVGDCYSFGEGVASDAASAYIWYKYAADRGHPAAMYNLGIMNRFGAGTKHSDYEAIIWFEKAADAGYSLAALALGDMYYKSSLKDLELAFNIYEELAEHGNKTAMVKLADMYRKGEWVCQSDRIADYYRDKAGFLYA